MTDQEMIRKAQKDYETMQTDRDAWKKHCFAARSVRDRWEKLALKYRAALNSVAEVGDQKSTLVAANALRGDV